MKSLSEKCSGWLDLKGNYYIYQPKITKIRLNKPLICEARFGQTFCVIVFTECKFNKNELIYKLTLKVIFLINRCGHKCPVKSRINSTA